MPLHLGKLLAPLKPTNLLAVVILVAVAYGGITVYLVRRRAERARRERQELAHTVDRLQHTNATLRQAVHSLEAQCVELRGFVKRLTAESRVADIRIVAQRLDAEGVPVSTLEFAERGRDGAPLPPRIFSARGREVYFDALVIKFMDDAVKVGDPLRGKSLHLFRRAFGSAEEPRNGAPLSISKSVVPDVYRGPPESSDFERQLWLRFWHWVDHPREAEGEGVRVAQIEAVGIPPVLHATYRITLRHSGGLEIKRAETEP